MQPYKRNLVEEFSYNFEQRSPTNTYEIKQNQETPMDYGNYTSDKTSMEYGSYNYEKTPMEYGNFMPENSRIPNGAKSPNEYTDDLLLEMLCEPHRSNVRALKMKTKGTRMAF